MSSVVWGFRVEDVSSVAGVQGGGCEQRGMGVQGGGCEQRGMGVQGGGCEQRGAGVQGGEVHSGSVREGRGVQDNGDG